MVEAIKSLVRPIVTYGFAATLVYGFVAKLVKPEVFITIATMAFTFYFVDRLVEKRVSQAAKLIAQEIKNDQEKKSGVPGDSPGSPGETSGKPEESLGS